MLLRIAFLSKVEWLVFLGEPLADVDVDDASDAGTLSDSWSGKIWVGWCWNIDGKWMDNGWNMVEHGGCNMDGKWHMDGTWVEN